MHTRTRRAARKKTTSAAEDDAVSNASYSMSPVIGPAVLLPDDLLSAQDDLRSLLGVDVDLAQPTSELLFTAYRALLGVQEEARAEVVRKEVELEQAIQDHESRLNELESRLDESRQETAAERQKNSNLISANAELNARLESMSATSTDNSALSRRVEEVEREKRDLLLVVDRLREDSVATETELESVRSRLKETRSELATVQTEASEAKSNETTAKFKLETTTQELEILRTDHARLTTSLSQKSEQLAALRRETASQITTLQSEVSAAQSTTNSLNATLASVRSAHESLQNQHTTVLEKLAQVQGDAGAERAQAKAQADARERLIALLEERNEEAVKRVREVEGEYEAVLERAERREHKLEAERDKAQARAEELDGVVRGFMAGEFAPGADVSMSVGNTSIGPGIPGTPRAGTPGGVIPSTPRNLGTPNPFATPSLLSPTAQLASRSQKGGKSYTEVYADYVRMSDELSKQKLETRRLEECLAGILRDIEERAPLLTEQRIEYERLQQTAADLTQQLADALKAQEGIRAIESDRDNCRREIQVLQTQLADLSRQVVVLTREVAIRDDPSLANEDFSVPNEMDEDTTATDELITSELVLFRSLPELQAQNSRLLRMTRELGDRLEKEISNSNEGENLDAALREAGEVVERLEKEVESLNLRTESLKRERDAWKRVARGNAPAESIVATSTGEERIPAELVPARVDEELLKQLEERTKEAAQLREELNAAQREGARLGAQVAKTSAQVTFLEEQRRLSAQTAEMQSRELAEMQRRVSEMQGLNTQLEIASSDIAEEARATAEKLRNDAALLRAENDLWKRSHLSELMRNLQTIQHEHERSGASEKRRLETDVKRLEADLEAVRARLDKETDRNRATVLQKDSELLPQNEDLSKTRETASVAENSRVHLQQRVDTLVKEAQSLREKLAVYEGRAPGAPMPEGLNREQQAALKIAELDLASAREHVEQFKAISEASEQALSEHMETWDTFKEEQEALIARKDADIAALEERLRGLLDDFTKTSSERNQFQRDLEAQRVSFEAEKRELEGAIADLSKVDGSAQAAHQSAQEDLRAQAALAQQANEKYERELLAHAEALKQINQLKSTITDLQNEVRKATTTSETASSNLKASEASWTRQKETMEKELSELTNRMTALQQQNALLHTQLEDVNTQAAKIRQTANAAAESLAIDSNESDVDSKMQQLREVIAFVRKEKEIVDLQLHLAQVDNTRVKSENERLAVALDEARTTLLKERAQAAEASVSSTQHAELVDKINQLNILRESNATLRSDSEANRKKAERLQSQLLRLKTEFEPIKLELVTAKAELEERQRQNEQFQKDIEQLKERFHDRIDPEQLSEATAAKEAAEAKVVEQTTEVEKLRNAARGWKERYENFSVKTREELTKRNNQIAQLETEKNEVVESARTTTAELEQLKAELAKVQASGGSSNDIQLKALEKTKAALQASVEELTAKVTALEASAAAAPVSVEGAPEQQSQIASLQAELEILRNEKQALEAAQTAVPSVDQESLKKEKEKAEEELKELRTKLQALETRNAKVFNDAKTFRREKIEAERKVQQLTTELAEAKANTGAEAASSTEESDAQREAEKAAAIEKAVTEATDKLRAELATGEKDAKPSEDIVALKAAHEEEVKKLNEEHAVKLAESKAASTSDNNNTVSEEALKTAREEGISAGKKELASKLTLLERKLQNKDASIATLSSRNAELEQLLKASSSNSPVTTAVPATETKAAPKRTGSISTPAAPTTAAANSAGLPGKPAPNETAPTTVPASAPAPAGAGRGTASTRARGTGATRGAAARGRGRGGMTGGSVLDGVNAVLGAAAATNTGGTSIAGAAKRPRESEAAATAEGGSELAKRLRSADPSNASAKSGDAATSTTAPTRVLPPRNRQPPAATQ
ncbi:filament-forming protein [Rhizoctonia solani AG-1 IA]|uniref:Filament-forming protein n=1 Tax=Thanatephorus cucumeris (strain AG1-IA) TaxID=983506 RepID=L8X5M3_THACA|nr:filament-forming protein [Rhizoctonia solani AG-1 IA]